MTNQDKNKKPLKKGEHLMGIDYGKKKIGIAVSGEDSSMAFPKYVLQNDEKIIEKIKKIATEENITKIIIGKSIDYHQTPNPIMKEISAFRRKIENSLKIKTDYEDEFLTTQEALRIQGRTDLTDASAAALILKSYLEKH